MAIFGYPPTVGPSTIVTMGCPFPAPESSPARPAHSRSNPASSAGPSSRYPVRSERAETDHSGDTNASRAASEKELKLGPPQKRQLKRIRILPPARTHPTSPNSLKTGPRKRLLRENHIATRKRAPSHSSHRLRHSQTTAPPQIHPKHPSKHTQQTNAARTRAPHRLARAVPTTTQGSSNSAPATATTHIAQHPQSRAPANKPRAPERPNDFQAIHSPRASPANPSHRPTAP